VTVPGKFEATIISLENTKDLSKLTLTQLINALQAQEQRRVIRDEGYVEEALQAKLQVNQEEKNKWKKYKKKNFSTQDATCNNNGDKNKRFPPCKHRSKLGHPPFKCWRRPDVKCEKCNKLGHYVQICKGNT